MILPSDLPLSPTTSSIALITNHDFLGAISNLAGRFRSASSAAGYYSIDSVAGHILHELGDKGCGFTSLGETWCDTATDVGGLTLTIMGGIGEFERGLIRRRCEEGIERAKRYSVSELTIWRALKSPLELSASQSEGIERGRGGVVGASGAGPRRSLSFNRSS